MDEDRSLPSTPLPEILWLFFKILGELPHGSPEEACWRAKSGLIPCELSWSRICPWTCLPSWRASSEGLRCLENLPFGVLISWCHQHSSAKPTHLYAWVVIYTSQALTGTKVYRLGEKCFIQHNKHLALLGLGCLFPPPTHTHSFVSHFGVTPRCCPASIQGGALLVWLPLS